MRRKVMMMKQEGRFFLSHNMSVTSYGPVEMFKEINGRECDN